MNDTPRGLETQKQVVIYMEESVGEFVKEGVGGWKMWAGGHPLIHTMLWPPTTTTSMSLWGFF